MVPNRFKTYSVELTEEEIDYFAALLNAEEGRAAQDAENYEWSGFHSKLSEDFDSLVEMLRQGKFPSAQETIEFSPSEADILHLCLQGRLAEIEHGQEAGITPREAAHLYGPLDRRLRAFLKSNGLGRPQDDEA